MSPVIQFHPTSSLSYTSYALIWLAVSSSRWHLTVFVLRVWRLVPNELSNTVVIDARSVLSTLMRFPGVTVTLVIVAHSLLTAVSTATAVVARRARYTHQFEDCTHRPNKSTRLANRAKYRRSQRSFPFLSISFLAVLPLPSIDSFVCPQATGQPVLVSTVVRHRAATYTTAVSRPPTLLSWSVTTAILLTLSVHLRLLLRICELPPSSPSSLVAAAYQRSQSRSV